MIRVVTFVDMEETPWFNRLYFTNRFFVLVTACGLLFVIGWQLGWPMLIGQISLLIFILLTMVDFGMLFLLPGNFNAHREIPPRLSNGDFNDILLTCSHHYPFTLRVLLVEELPFQFQGVENKHHFTLRPNRAHRVTYQVRPTERGVYEFGHTIFFLRSALCLVEKRVVTVKPQPVAVYPSFIKLKPKFGIKASAQSMEPGERKVRKTGISLEFDHIKEYNTGDDIRKINWKATARRQTLKVNHYTDEKSQQIYLVIDMGRLMKMPFENLSLLDYAINSSLMVANIALQKQDRVGLIAIEHKNRKMIVAEKFSGQLHKMQEALYSLTTNYLETDYEYLYLLIRKRITQRSLLILYTNFESITGLRRHLTYLKELNKHHLLLVVFFENSELKTEADKEAFTTEEVYTTTVAGKFVHDKRMVARELHKHGILTILTPPQQVTEQSINKYLELKARRVL